MVGRIALYFGCKVGFAKHEAVFDEIVTKNGLHTLLEIGHM
jgi:hypothetical protein